MPIYKKRDNASSLFTFPAFDNISDTHPAMSAASVVSQLRSLLDKADQVVLKLGKIYPTEDQWDALGDLSKKLAAAATTVGQTVQALKESRADRAWQESEKFRSQALKCQGDVLANGRLKQAPVFRRNIVTIFEGPKDSKFDTEDTRIRKATTRKRCTQVRQLSPDGLISWAIAFPPSLWAGGSMATDIFECLLENIEPNYEPSWPPIVWETLRTLSADEVALQESTEYQELLDGMPV